MKTLQDPFNDYREAIKAMTDPLQGAREAMKALQDPFNDYREAIKAMTDPLQGAREAMKALQDPLKDYRESIKAMTDPLRGAREAMKALQDPLKDYRESIKAMTDPLQGYHEAMKALRQPLRTDRGILSQIYPFSKEAFSTLTEHYASSIEHLDRRSRDELDNLIARLSKNSWPHVYDQHNDIFIDSVDEIKVNTQAFTYAEVQSIVDQVVEKASREAEQRLERLIAALAVEIRSLKSPLLEKLLTWIIFPLLVNIIFAPANAYVDYHVKEALTTRQAAKEIKRNVRTYADPTADLNLFRFVSTRVLVVRSKAHGKSAALGQLYLGQLVIIIKQKQDWTLISWADQENGVQIQGWVYTRYLGKLKR